MITAAKRKELARLVPYIAEAIRTECDAGFSGGLDSAEMSWLAVELRAAWNELDRREKALQELVQRLERAL